MTAAITRMPQGTPSARPAPAVSVVVPCYNSASFLDGLQATLAAQTFRDFEIVIVDDGSTDARSVQMLAQLDPAIAVIRQANKGPAAARNTGIRAARAPLVLALDCDDAISPDFLAATVPALAAAPADVGYVFSDMRLSGLNDEFFPQHFKLFDQLFVNRIPCCLLMRKSAWQASGGYPHLPRSADLRVVSCLYGRINKAFEAHRFFGRRGDSKEVWEEALQEFV